MCVGIPGKIIKIEGKKAIISFGEHTHQVDISFVSGKLQEGDYLLVGQGMAISKIKKDEAEQILKIVRR